ncbi:MAG TPA: dihydroneopterin aldolase [Acidimicrobiia bacterium]|nr:dihydroneopterin aldolase [Acidimicrobiia bacterium]
MTDPGPRPLGTISIKGIEVFGHHGVLASEARRGQPFLIDVEVGIDLDRAGRSDQLTDTLDYGELSRRIHDVVTAERWNLLERVARRVATVVMDDGRVEWVRATVHKPEAPLPVPFSDVAVTVTVVRS